MFLLLLAFILRVWGAVFGLPQFYFHTDETLTIAKIRGSISKEQLGALNVMHYILWVIDKVTNSAQQEFSLFRVMLFGRIFSAFLSTLTVFGMYLSIKELFNKKLAILTSLFLTVTFVDVQMAHYVRQDVYTHFFGIWSFYFTTLYYLKRTSRYAYISAFLIGLATSIRLNGAFFVVPLIIAFYPQMNTKVENLKTGVWIAISGLFGYALSIFKYLIENPMGDWPNLIVGPLNSQNRSVFASDDNGISSLSFFLIYLVKTGLYLPQFVLTISGIFIFLKKSKKHVAFMLSFPLIYFLVISAREIRFDRLLTALTPFLAFFAAYAALFLIKRWERVGYLIIGIVLLVSLGRIVLFDYAVSGVDTREESLQWFLENTKEEENIFTLASMDKVGYLLNGYGYKSVGIVYELDNPRIWQFPPGYVAISSWDYRVYENYSETSRYKNEYENFNLFKEHATLVKEFKNPIFDDDFFAPSYMEHSSTVQAYHNPIVQIYQVTK